MKLHLTILSLLLGISVAAGAGSNQAANKAALRLVLSEVQPGTLSSEHYCMLVFDDHNFHSEKSYSSKGKDQERKVYQGRLSDAEWNTLTAILDAKPFRELQVAPGGPTLVTEGLHPYAISVARQKGFQNMEFLTKASLKPYESKVKPLLQWWKSTRNQRLQVSDTDSDDRCTLNNSAPVFNK